MDPFWKDVIQVAAWIVAVVGGVGGLTLSILQRRADLQWRRTNKAQELIDDIHHHALASQATHMLDWYGSQAPFEYTLKDGVRRSLSHSQVVEALELDRRDCKLDTQIFVHDCFDWFFYFVDRIEHSINRRLIDRLDVEPIFKPYAKILGRDWEMFENFLKSRQYAHAKKFFESYQELRAARTIKALPATHGA